MIFERRQLTDKVLPEVAEELQAKPFRPHRLFRSGHAQTLLGFLYPRRLKPRSFLADEKRLFKVEPNVSILAYCKWQTGELERRHLAPTSTLR